MVALSDGGEPPKRVNGRAKIEGDGELTFFPARYAKTYQAWHAGLRDAPGIPIAPTCRSSRI